MPRQTIRNGIAGLDTRRAFDDSSLNSSSESRNVTYKNRNIERRKAHQKVNFKTLPTSALVWDNWYSIGAENQGALVITDQADIRWTASSDYTCEFAFLIEKLPPTGTVRQLLDGSVGARVTAAGVLELGWDTGAAIVYAAVGSFTVTENTKIFVSFTYDESTDELRTFIDGVFKSLTAAYNGSSGFNPQDVDVEIGSPPDPYSASQILGFLIMQELRFYNQELPDAHILQWQCKRLPRTQPDNLTAYGSPSIVELPFAHWPMDEGTGAVVNEVVSGNANGFAPYGWPWVLGLIPDSGYAARNTVFPSIGLTNQSLKATSTITGGGGGAVDDWNYYSNGNDHAWQFQLEFDAAAPAASASVKIMDLGMQVDAGVNFGGQMFVVFDIGGAAHLEYRFFDNSITALYTMRSTILQPRQAYNVIVSIDKGGAHNGKLYIDGGLQDEGTGLINATSVSLATTAVEVIDADASSTDIPDGWTYRVDEIRLQTSATIDDLMLLRVGVPLKSGEESDFVGLWNFNENGGLLARDFEFVGIDGANGARDIGTAASGGADVSSLAFDQRAFGPWGHGLVSPDPGDIRNIDDLEDKRSGENKLIVNSAGGAYQHNDETNEFEPLLGYFTRTEDKIHVNSCQFNRDLIFVNGINWPWVKKGGITMRLGIDRPGIPPSVSGGGAGTEFPAGTYKVVYRYSSPFYKSPLSPVTEFTEGAGFRGLTQTFGQGEVSLNPFVDKIEYFMTKADGEEFFFLGSLDNTIFPDIIIGTGATASFRNVDEADLVDPIIDDRLPPPLEVDACVRKKSRMIYLGGEGIPQGYFFAEPDKPEQIGALSFRELDEPAIGASIFPSGVLMIFGKTTREAIRGDIQAPTTRERTSKDGGCVSHKTLVAAGNVIYGLGPDGPFVCDEHFYRKIDETKFNGQVHSSIRRTLDDDTDKEIWSRASAVYDPDSKTGYLLIPDTDETIAGYADLPISCLFTLQTDIGAWSEYRIPRGFGVLGRRLKPDTSRYLILGVQHPGFVSQFEKEEFADGILSGDTFKYTVSEKDLTTRSIQLVEALPADGDSVKGLIVHAEDQTNKTITTIGRVIAVDQPNKVIYLDASFTAAVVDDADAILIGAYSTVLATKAVDGRTTVYRNKIWREMDMQVKLTAAGDIQAVFEDFDEIETKEWETTTKEESADTSLDNDVHFAVHRAGERMIAKWGTYQNDELEVYNYSTRFGQAGRR